MGVKELETASTENSFKEFYLQKVAEKAQSSRNTSEEILLRGRINSMPVCEWVDLVDGEKLMM